MKKSISLTNLTNMNFSNFKKQNFVLKKQSSQASQDQNKENIQSMVHLKSKADSNFLIKDLIENEPNKFKYKNLENEQLITALQIVESYNRFMRLYNYGAGKVELEFEKFVQSILNKNESDYFLNIIRNFIRIIVDEEIFNNCLIFNARINSEYLLSDQKCLNEICLVLIRMIDNLDTLVSSKKKDNCYLLKLDCVSHLETELNTKCLTDLSTQNKINICYKLINTILEGKTYRNNIELLQNDNAELKTNVYKLKLEIKQSTNLRSTDPSFKDESLYSLKTNQLKSLEKQSDVLVNALKNYCRISPIGRVKYSKNIYYYIWRFKTFSNCLLIEKRQDENMSSDWYKIQNTEVMIQILNRIKLIEPNKTDLIKGLNTEIQQIKKNIEVFIDFQLVEANFNKTEPRTINFEETLTDDESVKIIEDSLEVDIQSDCDDVKSDDDDKSFLNSILDKENIILIIKSVIKELVKLNLVNVSFKFDKESSFKSFEMNHFFQSESAHILFSSECDDQIFTIEKIRSLMLNLYEIVNKRYFLSKFSLSGILDCWHDCCLEASTLNRLKFLLIVLLKNIKWNQSIEKCQICNDINDEIDLVNYKNNLKQTCNECNKCFHLKCVIDKESGLFKSSKGHTLHVVCSVCFEQEELLAEKELENIEKKLEDDSKLNVYHVYSRSLRLKARENKKNENDYDSDSSIESRPSSSRKRKHISDNEDEDFIVDGDDEEEDSYSKPKRKRISSDDEDEEEDFMKDENKHYSKTKKSKHSKRVKRIETNVTRSLRPRNLKVNYCFDFVNDFE